MGGRKISLESSVRINSCPSTGNFETKQLVSPTRMSVPEIHTGSAAERYQLGEGTLRSGNISQFEPPTRGQLGTRLISAALVGVRCSGAAIDCASGVHMGAGMRAAHTAPGAIRTTNTTVATRSSHRSRRNSIAHEAGRSGMRDRFVGAV